MALTVGAKAPEFRLFDIERKERTLSEFLTRKTLLAFYPGAFTGVCTKEWCALRDAMTNFNNMNAQVIGISVDGPFANKGFADQNKITFPLLSDFTLEASKQYCGVHENFAGIKGYTTSKRAVFVLDKSGIVKYSWITDNPAVEPPYEEINKVLASF
jgi:glutaredoxin-dependent peroxiredoxin